MGVIFTNSPATNLDMDTNSVFQDVPGATISAWARDITNTGFFIIYTRNTGGSRRVGIIYNAGPGNVYAQFDPQDSGVTTISGGSPVAGATHYCITASFTGSTAAIYINGSLVNSSTPSWGANSVDNTSNDADMGSGGGGGFGGEIERIRVYQRELSAVEVMNLYLSRGRSSNVYGMASSYVLTELAAGATVLGAQDAGSHSLDATVPGTAPTYGEWMVGNRRRRR